MVVFAQLMVFWFLHIVLSMLKDLCESNPFTQKMSEAVSSDTSELPNGKDQKIVI